QLEQLPVLLALTVTRGEPIAYLELLTEITRGAVTVQPRPLGPNAVGHLVHEALGPQAAAGADVCRQVTGGNPLLLRALLTDLAARGIGPTECDAEYLRHFDLDGFSHVVRATLRRQPEDATRLVLALTAFDGAAPLDRVAA